MGAIPKMFPSSSKSCSNPFPYTYELPSFANDEQTGSSFLHFPSPFLDNDDLLQNHLLSPQLLSAASQAATEPEIGKVEPPPPRSEVVSSKKARKRTTGKKDRHSKIHTAQGLRDRRMRLSLQIARKFFDLQDMLGFDKASKTIEWLFTTSNSAIKELKGSLPQLSPTSSVSENIEMKQTSQINGGHKEGMGKCDTLVGVKHERKTRNQGFHPLSKDCRDKARARARERTREKMLRSLEKSKQCYEVNPNYSELAEESSSPSQDMNSPIKAAAEVEEPAVTHLLEHQMATVGIIGNFLGMESSTLTWPSILNYSYNTAGESSDGIYSTGDFLGFQGGWNMENARIHESNYCTCDGHQRQNPCSSYIITSNTRSQLQFLGN